MTANEYTPILSMTNDTSTQYAIKFLPTIDYFEKSKPIFAYMSMCINITIIIMSILVYSCCFVIILYGIRIYMNFH